ncbi:MAG: hypothetical protein ACFFF9_03885 [Candidatus Thorarchaeota archaeon]
MAEIEAPSGHQPPENRSGGSSDLSTKGLVKAACFCCFVYYGIGLIIVSQWMEFSIWSGPLLLIGILCCVAGPLLAINEWKVFKRS